MISDFQFLPHATAAEEFLREEPFGHRDGEGRWCLNILVLYDDREAAAHALQTVGLLCPENGSTMHFVPTFWQCDLLSSDLIWEASMNAALNAELIILASREGDALPQEMDAWVQDYYAQCADEEPALVYTLPKVLT